MTDLEALIRHLAGREPLGAAGATSGLGDQLADPASDASQVLDEIRRRTRSLLDDPDDAPVIPPDPRRPDRAATGPRRRRRISGLLPLAIGLALLAGAGWIYRAAERSAADRAGSIQLALDEIRGRLRALAAAAAPAPAAVAAGPGDVLGHLDAQFAALGARLDRLGRKSTRPDEPRPHAEATDAPGPRPPGPDPLIGAINSDVAAIRRELASSEAATTRQIQEMRSILQEVNTVVRRVLSRPEPASNANLGPVLALAVQALTHNLQHPSAQVRGEAAEQLARIGGPARTAIPALRALHNRETDPNVRTAIETALAILTSN